MNLEYHPGHFGSLIPYVTSGIGVNINTKDQADSFCLAVRRRSRLSMTNLFQGAPKGLMLNMEAAWKRNSADGDGSTMGLLFGVRHLLAPDLRFSKSPNGQTPCPGGQRRLSRCWRLGICPSLPSLLRNNSSAVTTLRSCVRVREGAGRGCPVWRAGGSVVSHGWSLRDQPPAGFVPKIFA